MKLFISWSGERSKLLAESLRDWLPGVINAVEPWLSSYDIDPGARWGPALARQLENTKYGIICLTPENLTAPWILFEAGALSKYVEDARVVPLILDLKPTDIKGPLTQFQSLRVKENDIKILVTKINQAVIEAGEKSVEQAVIERSFKLWWPELKESINAIPEVGSGVKKSERSEREMIEEILLLVRSSLQPTPVASYISMDRMMGDLNQKVNSTPGFDQLPEDAKIKLMKDVIEMHLVSHKTSAKNLKPRNPDQARDQASLPKHDS